MSAALTGTTLRVDHIESEGVARPYWHLQRLAVASLTLSAARGLTRSFALEATLPIRLVRDRIRFDDLARQPYVPPEPDLHHRNETLARVADPRLGLQWARALALTAVRASAGVGLPVGRTEENPFALGRAGAAHQHIQFGTGTWDPYASVGALRPFGALVAQLDLSTQLALAQNTHGYRAGDRWSASATISRGFGAWSGTAGAELSQEGAETWAGRREEEGNLGRTDVWARVGAGRRTPWGAMSLNVRAPLASDAAGAQTSSPLVLQVSLAR